MNKIRLNIYLKNKLNNHQKKKRRLMKHTQPNFKNDMNFSKN